MKDVHSDRNPYRPNEQEQVRILGRLLKLARAGQLGPIYCYGQIVEIGTWAVAFRPMHVCMERRRISWREALNLAETWVETKKPMEVAKRRARLPGSMTRRRAG